MASAGKDQRQQQIVLCYSQRHLLEIEVLDKSCFIRLHSAYTLASLSLNLPMIARQHLLMCKDQRHQHSVCYGSLGKVGEIATKEIAREIFLAKHNNLAVRIC